MIEPMVACGYSHTMFVKSDGTLWGCGYNNYRQVGTGNNFNVYWPTKISTNIDEVVCGNEGTICMKNGKAVSSYGRNTYGELNRSSDIKQTACGSHHTIYLKNDGSVWGCGYNSAGQLGLGDRTSRSSLTKLDIKEVKQVFCGGNDTFFLKNDGTVWACGNNQYRQLGLGDTTSRLTPEQLTITNVKQVASGGSHTIFVKNDGTVWGCGLNGMGELGISGVTNVKQAACGHQFTILLKTDGTVWACGNNEVGQLGIGGAGYKENSVKVAITDVKQVICGGSHTIFLKNDGTVWGCGSNGAGQLGLGNNVGKKTIPVQLGIDLYPPIFLLQDTGSYKTIENKVLKALTSQRLTAGNFEQNGFTEVSAVKDVWSELGEQFKLFIYDKEEMNSSITMNHLPPAQLIKQMEDIDLSDYSCIRKLAMKTSGYRGTIKLALSFDCGVTWKTLMSGKWQDIELITEAIMSSGLTPSALSAITMAQWMSAVTGTLRIAYVLSKTSVSDDIAIDSLAITGDTASWKKAQRNVDYNCQLPNTNTMIVQFQKDGSYKVNYMEAKQKRTILSEVKNIENIVKSPGGGYYRLTNIGNLEYFYTPPYQYERVVA